MSIAEFYLINTKLYKNLSAKDERNKNKLQIESSASFHLTIIQQNE